MSLTELHWSSSNAKLREHRVVSFGLPAGVAADGFNVCPAKGICAGYCFARQGFYVFPWVARAREANLAAARGDLHLFTESVLRDLDRMTWSRGGSRRRRKTRRRAGAPTAIRVHDSGDFFSLEYLRAWYRIARVSELTFYAYTKMHARLAPAVWDEKPGNFILVQSIGGKDDASIDARKPHARVFLSHEDRRRAGYKDGTSDDTIILRGEKKIGLVFHGSNRPLTPAQIDALAVPGGSRHRYRHRHNRTRWRDGALRVVS